MEETITPLYLNWSFWAVAISALAVTLSQLPPIHILIKRAKLDLELYSKIAITHKVGNPNLQLHLIINNNGGRRIRIKDIQASITKDNKLITTLPAQNYLHNQNDNNTLLFTSFSLNPNEEWAHLVNLLRFFNHDEEKEYRSIEANMLSNFRDKNDKLTDEQKSAIELDNEYVQPANDFFNKHFIWKDGEFSLKVNIITDHEPANISKTFRFTVFESHAEQLKVITKHYKYGGGIWWDPNIQTNVILEVKEA